ncbi:MAG: hypothetical protein ACXADY_13530 [Candidatus Hodarchaeales archaeon]|jgi:hypothetical protein
MNDNNALIDILREIKIISHQLMSIESSLSNVHNFLAKLTELESSERSNLYEVEKPIMPSSLEILNLQDSRPGLFTTYKTIQRKEDWVTSSDIALETGRSRGLESRYLNYLADNGFILKKRVKVTPESKATEVLYRTHGVNE